MKKRKMMIAVLLVMVILMYGCQKDDSDKTIQSMIFLLPGEASTFDPSFSNETYSASVLLHMYEGLVKIDPSGNLIPGAAESFDVTDQNKTFTFKLRKDLKWSDGKAVTAQDYKYAWMRFIDPTTDALSVSVISPYILNITAYMNGEVDADAVGIYVLDDYTLQIKTSVPTPFLPDILTHNIFAPLRADILADADEDWWMDPELTITNGPFTLSEYKTGSYIELKKNPNYWDADNIKLDTIKFSFRADDTDVVDLYNNKMIDGMFEITASELRNIPDGELVASSTILPSTAFMTFNHDNPLMQNVEFRKAIYIAIDRKAVVDEVLLGAGIPTKYFVPINYQIAGEGFRDYTELDDGKQIEEAKAILQNLRDQGVYKDEPITFHYMLNGPDAEVSEYLIAKLSEDLGLEFDVIGLNWADLYELALNGDYDMLMMGWGADYPHPMTFLTMFSKDGFYEPITRWHDKNYDKMIDDFLLITDEKEGLEKLRAIEDMVIDDYHIVPVYYRKGLSVLSQNIKGWYRAPVAFNFTRASLED